MAVIKTQNASWGFAGTTASNCQVGPAAAADAFARMGELLIETFTISEETAREFLDSRGGRFLADFVCTRNGEGGKLFGPVRFESLPAWTRGEIRRMTGK